MASVLRSAHAVLPRPTPPTTDPDPAGAQPMDRLMVRVMVPLFAAGSLAIALLWWVEWSDGKLRASNRVAYPLMLVLFTGCVLALHWRPGTVRVVCWIGFLAVAVSQLGDLADQLLQSGPLIGNYNAITLFTCCR